MSAKPTDEGLSVVQDKLRFVLQLSANLTRPLRGHPLLNQERDQAPASPPSP